jgi:hypothetical protein
MKTESRTITFQPDPNVRSLLKKAVARKAQATGRRHGHLSRLINDALWIQFASLRGKREA